MNGCLPFKSADFDTNKVASLKPESTNFLMVIRGGCGFNVKLKNAMSTGASVLIVVNNEIGVNWSHDKSKHDGMRN